MTWELVTEADLHTFRKTGIGGSDVASILGLNRYTSAAELWAEKTGLADPQDLSDVERIQWGNLLEPVIIGEVARRYSAEICMAAAMVRYTPEPHCIGNIDAVLRFPEATTLVAYCRTMDTDPETGESVWLPREVTIDAGSRVIVDAKNSGGDYQWRDRFPINYECQGRWYCGILGLRYALFAVLLSGNELRLFLVEHDDADFEAMRDAARAFWASLSGDCPPNLEDAPINFIRRVRPIEPDSVLVAAPDLTAIVREWLESKGERDYHQEEMDRLRKSLEVCMGNAARLEVPDIGVTLERRDEWHKVYDVPDHVKAAYLSPTRKHVAKLVEKKPAASRQKETV